MLTWRTESERRAYFDGFKAGIETTAQRLEMAKDETSRDCIVKALRDMADLAAVTNTAIIFDEAAR